MLKLLKSLVFFLLLRSHFIPDSLRLTLLLELPARFEYFDAISGCKGLRIHLFELCSHLSDDFPDLSSITLVSCNFTNHLTPLHTLILTEEECNERADQHIIREIDASGSI